MGEYMHATRNKYKLRMEYTCRSRRRREGPSVRSSRRALRSRHLAGGIDKRGRPESATRSLPFPAFLATALLSLFAILPGSSWLHVNPRLRARVTYWGSSSCRDVRSTTASSMLLREACPPT
jgi:hypothetical protein